MEIRYTKDFTELSGLTCKGFFVGWPNPPSDEGFFDILQNSYRFYAATHDGKIIGFINAVSDGVLTAYIPLLEVVEEYQGKGIGIKLVELMLEELRDLYMVDICHDEHLITFYGRFQGSNSGYSTVFRNYEAQSGRKPK